MSELAAEYRPTLKDRLARALGFRFHLGAEPVGVDNMPGWARTEVRLQFSVMDRLRILFSGRVHVDLTHYADQPIDVMKSRSDLRIPAPWETY